MDEFDAIVVGAGHAGCEAALALARTKNKTLLLSLSLDAVAFWRAILRLAGLLRGNSLAKWMLLAVKWE